jgi:hypothetical protein
MGTYCPPGVRTDPNLIKQKECMKLVFGYMPSIEAF